MTYNPWRDLRDRYPHIHVELHPIAPANAFWAIDLDIVIVNSALSRAERRFALAHEIAHMDVGDRAVDLCWFSTRQETAADRLAARRLVRVCDLADAVRWCHGPAEVAAELEVPHDVLALRWRWMHPSERSAVEAAHRSREAVA